MPSLFFVDQLSYIMLTLIGFISLIVGCFANKYMEGDGQKNTFLIALIVLTLSLGVMVTADNLLLFLCAWLVSNILLVQLMIYKTAWRAAVQSGLLAAKTLLVGFTSLLLAFFLLYKQTHLLSIHAIVSQHTAHLPLVLVVIAAMTQSAIWPFHKWLLSSLNSPTPTSALMHAGLVNGGGFLLVRFSPMYFSHIFMLHFIFVVGLIAAITGMVWKLLQSDVKRMLACSTSSQMGFMFVQCGLGMFPAAVAHLCLHGLFKANAFLNANSSIYEKPVKRVPFNFLSFSLAFVFGLAGAIFFTLVAETIALQFDTGLFLIAIAWVFCSQVAYSSLRTFSLGSMFTSLLTAVGAGLLYGASVKLIEYLLPAYYNQPQPLSFFYIAGLLVFVAMWLSFIFTSQFKLLKKAYPHLYVSMLNKSQPHPKTITTQRRQYQYK